MSNLWIPMFPLFKINLELTSEALNLRISSVALRAVTRWMMIDRYTVSVRSATIARARINAALIDATKVCGTVRIRCALRSWWRFTRASNQSIAQKSRWARANVTMIFHATFGWACTRIYRTRTGALSIETSQARRAFGIGSAYLLDLFLNWSTSDRSIADVIRQTFTDHRSHWQRINNRAFCVRNARLRFSARIFAASGETCEFARTFGICAAFRNF